jgi:hypothetical protein
LIVFIFSKSIVSILLSKYFTINHKNHIKITIKIMIAILIFIANKIQDKRSQSIEPQPLYMLYLDKTLAYSQGVELLKI